MTEPLPDADQRQRFENEGRVNFSIVAAAGAGKTTAIARRIAALAQADPALAPGLLESLVIVTYTRKAAAEMQQRARAELLRSAELGRPVSAQLMASFNRAFFGTIHSFCILLLREQGHALGLPTTFEMIEAGDLEDVWCSFLATLPEIETTEALRHLPIDAILDLARVIHPRSLAAQAGEKPDVNLLPIEAAKLKGSAIQTGERSKEIARDWEKTSRRGDYSPLPEPASKAKDFVQAWRDSFGPLAQWLTESGSSLALDISKKFLDYRIRHGLLTYEDQVTLAADLFEQPEIGEAIRRKGYRVLLDEAQDTDPDQFRVLIGVAQQNGGDWLNGIPQPLRPGAFSMVGDPQQCLYPERAEPSFYEKVRQQLKASGGEELTFNVTMRCGREIVQFVNESGELLLNGMDGQAKFVSLHPRPEAVDGRVLTWEPPMPEHLEDLRDSARATHEAAHLGLWLKKTGFAKLGARDWNEVAILCPSNAWLVEMAQGLDEVDLQTQMLSSREARISAPFYRWLYALSRIFTQPRDAYEVVGVLREIYGISDADLAEYSQGAESRFHLTAKAAGNSAIATALAELSTVRKEVFTRPLREGIQHLCDKMLLTERLAALLPRQKESILEDYGTALLMATQEEREGASFEEWTRGFERFISGKEAEMTPRKGCIQLITCYKAKGLEWDCVIVPFLSRQVREQNRAWPLVVHPRRGETALIGLDSFWMPDIDEQIKRERIQLRQRLLYVSLTRARKTLLLLDDTALFKKTDSSLASQLGDENRLKTCSKSPPGESIPAFVLESDDEIDSVLKIGVWERARENAEAFIERTLPHELHSEDDPSDETRGGLAESEPITEVRLLAQEYGTWWHKMCEFMPWHADEEGRLDSFTDALQECPNPDRARKEWELLQRSLLLPRLNEDGLIIHREMPMLQPISSQQCVEGIMDLAAFSPKRRMWLLVDWKTDRVAETHRSSLIDLYRGQLMAYQQALVEMTGIQVEATIYATRTGDWLKLGS